MSIRLYVGNLPRSFETKDLDDLFASVGEGIRFKPVNDRETGECRGFGFINVDDGKLAEALIERCNGMAFGGNSLKVERSERKDTRGAVAGSSPAGGRRGGTNAASRKAADKLVHSEKADSQAPDPRWAGDLARLKALLDQHKATV